MGRVGWIGALALGALVCGCGPRVLVGSSDSASSTDDGTSSTTEQPGTTLPGTTEQPGTTLPGTTEQPGTTIDPSDTDFTTGIDATTGVPTTAAEEGGTPGGAGPTPVPDEPDDVRLPQADVIAAAVYTDGTMLDFRAQLATTPYGVQATYDVTWCLAAGTGMQSCATAADNIDHYVGLTLELDGEFVGLPPIDACLHAAFEHDTNTVRVLVPADLYGGITEFDWILEVNFGGSGGNAEWVPDSGALAVQHVDELPPFDGDATCG